MHKEYSVEKAEITKNNTTQQFGNADKTDIRWLKMWNSEASVNNALITNPAKNRIPCFELNRKEWINFNRISINQDQYKI